MPTDSIVVVLLALVLGSLAWALYWLHCCLLLLAEVRVHVIDTRTAAHARHEALTGSLNALHGEVRHGPRLTHLPEPKE